MADAGNRDRTTDERFGRHVHEGMNAGVSRNAHVSGESRAASRDADALRADEGGTPTGPAGTGGTPERGTSTGGGAPRGADTGGTPPGPHGTHSAWGGTSSVSHHDGVGSEAPSGMEEIEHDAWERGERP